MNCFSEVLTSLSLTRQLFDLLPREGDPVKWYNCLLDCEILERAKVMAQFHMDWPSNLVDFNHKVKKFYTFDHRAAKTIVAPNSNMACTDLIVLDFLVDGASKEWRVQFQFLVPNALCIL